MSSFRQIEANRHNARLSTGPVTEEGKKRSRQNAIRHGLTAETVITAVEDAEDYAAFEMAVTADYDAQRLSKENSCLGWQAYCGGSAVPVQLRLDFSSSKPGKSCSFGNARGLTKPATTSSTACNDVTFRRKTRYGGTKGRPSAILRPAHNSRPVLLVNPIISRAPLSA